ncbi:MAG: hypothetical protein AAGI11_14185 [Pseudomonadota bacterium]
MNSDAIRLEEVQQPLQQPLRDDILALWEREQAVIPAIEERLAEVVAVAWSGDALAGVASTGVVQHPGIKQPLFFMRAMVGSDYRKQGLAYLLHRRVVEIMEDRFDRGEDTRAIGVYVEVERAHVQSLEEAFCSFSHVHSEQNRPVQFNLSGFTDDGFPQYIYYFEHASLIQQGPVIEPPSQRAELIEGAEIRFCLNELTSAQQQQIIGLWLTYGMLPDRDACLKRLPQVLAVALEHGAIIGVASAFTTELEDLRAKMLGYRTFVSPDAKGGFYGTKLLAMVMDELNRRAKTEPQLKDIQGVAIALQNENLNKNVTRPRGGDVGTSLVGYLGDRQLRVIYFDGATVKMQQPSEP